MFFGEFGKFCDFGKWFILFQEEISSSKFAKKLLLFLILHLSYRHLDLKRKIFHILEITIPYQISCLYDFSIKIYQGTLNRAPTDFWKWFLCYPLSRDFDHWSKLKLHDTSSTLVKMSQQLQKQWKILRKTALNTQLATDWKNFWETRNELKNTYQNGQTQIL